VETFLGLYRILIAVSAGVLILGLLLLFKKIKDLDNSKKHLYILAVVNVISMLTFLFNIKNEYNNAWKEVVIFLNSAILVLNLTIGYFVYQSWNTPKLLFSKQIMKLFLISFLSICFIVIMYYSTGSKGSILDKSNNSFIGIYSFSILLYGIGSFIPAARVLKKSFRNNIKIPLILLLILLNGLNNSAGLIFYTLEIPNKESGVMINIIFNLLFAYAIGYYFLLEYFEGRKQIKVALSDSKISFSWESMRLHLNYWGELKNYLNVFYPDIINEVDLLPLSELEKTHLVLKKLNIKAKDIAGAMNVSVKAIEMNRYRINVKLKSLKDK